MVFRHIFFDLDHTLWDFEKSSHETLFDLFHAYQIGDGKSVTAHEFVHAFQEINTKLWNDYQRGVISKQVIRDNRFALIYQRLGLPVAEVPPRISHDYLHTCPTKPYLIDGCLELLGYLTAKGYRLHILTNGFSDVQLIKLKSAGIEHYFEHIITSESIGAMKPHPSIFQHALNTAGALLSESVMIGDSLETDIAGAMAVGMPCIYFNPNQTLHKYSILGEVNRLADLKSFL
jgi:putative hydrolase of the HAD superfamily